MAGSANARVAIVVARTVDRFVGKFDFSALEEGKRVEALQEVAALRRSVGKKSLLIDSAFGKLERALQRRAGLVTRTDPLAARKLALLLRTLAPLATASTAMAAFVAAAPAYAEDPPAIPPIPTSSVGAEIFNPVTNANETVVEVYGSPGYAVRTDADHVILLVNAVGQKYTATDQNGNETEYEVTEVFTTQYGDDDVITSVKVKDADNNESTAQVFNDFLYPPEYIDGGDGSGNASVDFPAAVGDQNRFSRVVKGDNGGDGHDGGGVKICIPLIGCATIAYKPSAGGSGADGPTVTVVPSDLAAVVTTTANNRAGVIAGSIGGDGGDGGDGYGVGIPGASGGRAGNGGTVTLTAGEGTTIVTTGANSQGIFVKSAAGQAGDGGSGYIASGGGSGGSAAAGGSASVYSDANIETSGVNSAGILVQSLGGGSGDGGSSYGIVGSSGSGSVGGNGGAAYAQNGGTIVTHGDGSYGVQAQSIGGSGGSSGDAGGLAAFVGNGGGAGTGGTAEIRVLATSSITTHGASAHGLFAQSVGGGGGSSGSGGGLVALGGNAASGGTGGNVTITADDGSYIETFGEGAFGIFAESIGGSGGSSGSTGGAVAIGGSGGTGNNAGDVTVTSGSTIITHEKNARGVFAQSIGGGGGSAHASGGIVSIGGSGSAGGQGGDVEVTLTAASDITTLKDGADGAFAQSVGGGGGAGAGSGGVVALGGKGGSGGTGGEVTLTNAGSVHTEGDFARGLFAQSIGGGGGSGGASGGLVTIGGSGSVASTGGEVTIGNTGAILTKGNMSSAMQAQSIGGGGGDGGSSGGVFLTIGGSGAAGSDGGAVNVGLAGDLTTFGNDSHGVFAQSIGGGGGNGGNVNSVGVFVGVAIGGSGSSGGLGGDVDIDVSPTTVVVDGVSLTRAPIIRTSGDRSRGVYAQSVGGGGGNGGYAVNLTPGAFGAVSVSLGGEAGDGGDGGVVDLSGALRVITTGDYSQGIFLQSVGGGGGAGGFAVAGALSAGIGFSGSVAVGLGGAGGKGGLGGTVLMDSGGSIITGGDFSTGLLAQSVGGGGGAGGFSVAAGVAASETAALAITVGIGGSGGDGGAGGIVDVSFDGDIATGVNGEDGFDYGGDNSVGALIQSVGGGGGSGGFNVSGAIAGAGAVSGGVAVGLGGNGGKGGHGGQVTGSIGGNISTAGDRSSGAIIQSIGGGGGSGGFNVSGTITASGTASGGVSVGLGGSGAGAGNGGTVNGSVGGKILTVGDQSDGLLVQSVGGGGGSGGFNVSGNIAASGVVGIGVSVGLGGSGGSGGNGGSVTAHAYDTIQTRGDQSRGFIAQSIGGGGGAGAFNISGNLAIGGTGGASVGVGLGGSGGAGGDALGVIASAKDITTLGNDSAGFIAQSIGGGGGAGGFNITAGLAFSGTGSGSIGVGLGGAGGDGGNADTVNATVTGNVVTKGDRSGAILAQSVGGGGGSGGFNVTGGIAASGVGAASVSIGIGGSGGSAGNAKAVTLNVIGAALTGEADEDGGRGQHSDGIVAQSIGGGGGNGAFNVSGDIAAGGIGAAQVGVGIGGHGGGGGSAGAVNLNVNNGVTTSDLERVAVITQQNRSAGIIAQSIGGGGGNGGFNVTGGMSFGGEGAGGVNVGIGGTGGRASSAGAVTADISGYVHTLGNDSLGILAQSVGGGGGNGGFNVTAGLTFGMTGSGSVNVGIGGGAGGGGNGEAVTLRINDQIETPDIEQIAVVTKGDRSAGVIAQSLGGGGGNGGFNVSAGINVSGGYTGGANIGVGGMGGEGGSAANVIADITGIIATSGVQSGGLLVQSAGGGGGNGGFNVGAGLSLGMTGAANLGVGVGGFGGKGGSGADVTLDYNQRTDDEENTLVAVMTTGADSDAVIVQSLGGGGGNGGFNVTGNVALAAGTGAGNLGVGIGGFAGDGGGSGVVTSRIAGDIGTAGVNSDALLVQSLGGGGGNGGFNVTAGLSLTAQGVAGNMGFGLGGFGGKGGAGNTVSSTLVGDVATLSNSSTGVTVQSIGGGGGNGGFNVTAGLAVTAQGAAGNLGVGVGGFGGGGGAAGSATSVITGNVETRGADSYGLLVQSAGGGGGNGGFNVTGNLSATAQGAAGNLGIGIGGFGGEGGAGNAANSTLVGNLLTRSGSSNGVTVQSLGGGGGNGGFNVTGNVALTAEGAAGNLGVGIGGFGGKGGLASTAYSSITGVIQTEGANSYAVLVQSAGGGGGNGGFNVTGSLGVSAQGAVGNLGIGIGGFGGFGGGAAKATSILTGLVVTMADYSSGVTVQSLGGGGGNGGFNVTGNLNATAQGAAGNLGVGVGGFGGDGGAGGDVSNTITGSIYTRGTESYALLVQSQGGGGGNGGFNVTGNIALSGQGGAANLGVGIGGFGGKGGDAGDVTSNMIGDIETGTANLADERLESNKSSGATIQSIGGGGGNGGFNVTGGISVSMGSTGAGNVGIGVGGFGGDGGDGGTVTATQTGNILTRGDDSYGILVQSAGGGGGNGAFNVTGGVTVSKGSTGNVGIGIGGFGADGGVGKAVDARLTGNVLTGGNNAYGATIQSLGGGGGSGGMNITGGIAVTAGAGSTGAASIGIGGFGGGGGDAGTVNGFATGRYQTVGDDSDGVLVQSVGGGGGSGGMNISGTLNLATGSGTAVGAAIGVGGFGGGAGHGNTVVFTRTGDTFTDGANSNGVTIQSLGGGGGRGGVNVSGAVSAGKGSATSIGVGLGGFGGEGGDGGDVTGAVYGNVFAMGLESDEMVPVYDLSDLPDDVEITDPEELAHLLVIGEQRVRSGGSTGVLIQSVGGGGGSGGTNITGALSFTTGGATPTGRTAAIGVGGFGGKGGNAGTVNGTVAAERDATERVQVHSVGDSQMAVAVQSIGGGGGAGGMNISGGISTAGQLVVGVGGFGGEGGTGGDVIASVDADLFAAGNNSIGFLAQSIGGGGGAGGINISGGIQAATKGTEPAVVFGLGGFGGAGNISGDVTATQNGQVLVEGAFAYGVLAQSVGGGGGAGGLNISAALTGAGNKAKKTEGIAISAGVGGNGGTGANAGDVTLVSNGNVFMNTDITEVDGELEFSAIDGAMYAPGVVAQSIGGGGGAGGMNLTGSFAPKGQPIAIGVGGTGAAGGDAGNVTLTRGYGENGPGVIMTFGQGSHGLVAQSIGGGGGNAGFNLVVAANKSKPKTPQLGAAITIGGDGGASGDGADVEVKHLGDIYTNGGGSNGILAQSISNGGGSGATNITGALMMDSSVLSLAIGGRGGDGGNSGNVTVTHGGTIVTQGAASAAIRAQSIGSGGGDASAEEDLTAFFADDWPVDVPIPIGAKNEISVGIGDVGGKGGVAGDVSVTAAGLLVTRGEDAVGIHAQSIGGSGGASSSISVGVSGENKSGSQSGGVSVAVGLEGGEGGIAGDVTVSSSAQVLTEGERARGIFAQSLGGSGGSGGDASNNLENASNEMHISVGGPGGSGAVAGDVTVTQRGLIDTRGDDADGILAQSIGGGGGAGGASGTQTLTYESTDSNTVAIAVGGSGGNGAIAGDVSVTNGGVIMTSGDHSFGIRAQSIGGGGGVGGAIDSKKLLITGTANSVEFNVGGSGGEGSQAGDVDVTNTGLIWTTGVGAAAISANSIGGGGGDAGSILDLAVSAATSNTFKANIGGTGGSGGVAGDVTVINTRQSGENGGFLITEGDGAYGIFAQSLGGSGGNSSTILSITVDGGSGSVSAGFNFGNAGGTGNLAGDVLVDNGGLIDTSGAGAHGILAQSIGGGGGNGGIVLSGNINITMPVAAPLISVGGSGGDGGDAGNVEVINSGSIVTRGDGAHGIVAQSIGGGGGNAGVALAVTGEPGSLIVGNTLAATLGATVMTGTGGEGGNVTVTHTGDITVLGKGSQAIVAESINGGGGTLTLEFDQIAAMFDDEGSDSAEAPDPMLVAARAGSTGSSGMVGGKVTVNSTGSIAVGGEGGVAVSLSSIGGGGGTIELRGSLVSPADDNRPLSGMRTTFAAPVTVPVGVSLALGAEDGSDNGGADIDGSQEGAIVTTEINSLGLLIQSIGGGGGRGIADFEVEDLSLVSGSTTTIGGINQTDSGGGNVTHIQDGTITTLGDFSIGGLIQSVGGGGGVATVSYREIASEGLGTTAASEGLQTFAVAPLETTSTVTLGASGGTGNDGGAVSQTISGGALAAGDYSAALLLQSIGAGGGATILSGDTYPLVRLGGRDGAEGSGGAVSLTNNGTIGSLGVGSYGVVLQSIGGGGGTVFGDFTDAEIELSEDNVGDGGAITFTQIGDVAALGDSSVGILAQSLGGGGGFVFGQFAGTAGGEGAGGAITLDVDGGVVAYGIDSTAVLAQSLGTEGGGNIRLLSTGDIRGGGGTGMAINFEGGAENLIDTDGTVSAVSGLAIKTTTGNDTVENRGAIVGNVFLGEGTNLLHNNAGAAFVTISTIDLRDGAGTGTFVNDGTIEMGLRAPRYPIDLDAGDTFEVPAYDDIRTATLYGTRVISQVALDGDFVQSASGEIWYDVAFGPYAADRIDATGNATVDGTAHITLTWLENSDAVTLISTGGTGTDLGLDVPGTIALDYKILAGPEGIQLGFDSDFGQPFLNANQQQLGHHMDSALDVGGASGIGRLLALLGNLTEGQEDVYSAIFAELDPEALLAPAIENLDSARDFSKRVMGCDPFEPELQACVWGRAEIHKLERKDDKAAPVDLGDTARFRIGAAAGLGDGWSVGGAFGLDSLGKLTFDGQRAEGDDGEALHVGLGVGKTFGADGRGSAGINLAAGWQNQGMARVQDVFEPAVGTWRLKSDYVAGNLSLGYSFGNGPWFIRPNVDASAIRLSLDGFEERGLGGLGMAVDQADEWYLAVEPKLTVGARFNQVHFALTGGGMFANRDAISAPMRFLGANAASDPAMIGTLIDDKAFVGGVEFGVDASSQFDLSIGYQGYLGSQVESHTGTLNLRMRF